MKKLVLTAIAVTCAVSAFAQGTVTLNMQFQGTSHVYAPLNASDTTAVQGQGPGDGAPTGSTSYGGRVLIGAGGTGGRYGAAGTFAVLLGAPGNVSDDSSMLPSTPIRTFRIGANAGVVAPSTATFSNIPKDSSTASFELVVWDNFDGLYPDWNSARTAWNNGTIAAGKSAVFHLNNIGGDVNTPPSLFPGLTSFNLYFLQTIPEPSTFALAGLGVAALMIFRRRK